MMEYWQQLKPSERLMMSIGGIVIAVLMLYLLLLEPYLLEVESLTKKVAQQNAKIEWLKKTSVEVKQLQRLKGKNAVRNNSGQSLLVIVDQTAKKNKLASALKRVEPDGSNRVRVWMDAASFDDVAKWLAILRSTYHFEVETAVFDKVDVNGLVNVRLVFVEGDA